MGLVEDLPGGSEPVQQARPGAAPSASNPLARGQGPGPLGQVFGAQQLPANWSREQLVRPGKRASEEP
nr:hypothetical protein [uncultured bacterium]